MVLANRGRGLVQIVAAGVADAGVNTLDAGLGPFPVAAELRFAAHRLLRLAQSSLMPLKTVEWNVERAVRERCKPRLEEMLYFGNPTLGCMEVQD